MEKRVLIIASVASMIGQFNRDNISLLQEMGYKVDVACNFKKGSTFSEESAKRLKKELIEQGVRCFHVDFSRSPVQMGKHVQCYRTVKRLMLENQYLFCHCHSPIGGAIARIAGHATKTKIIYTAHGFHFYKGASVLNWAIYYPIELLLSYWTNCLITINKEDYYRAKHKFHAKKTVYIPGVGIDTKLFREITTDRNEKRLEIGVKAKEILILSVGELSVRKNHMVILDAMIHLEDNVKYYIVGQGPLKEIIERRAKELGISKRVKLLGYRNDIKELLWAADIFAFPSLQEGLPVALMEAEAARIPLVASDIRGNNDIVRNGENGYLVKVNNSKEYEYAFKNIINGELKNLAKVKLKEEYDIKNINKIMREYYLTI